MVAFHDFMVMWESFEGWICCDGFGGYWLGHRDEWAVTFSGRVLRRSEEMYGIYDGRWKQSSCGTKFSLDNLRVPTRE